MVSQAKPSSEVFTCKTAGQCAAIVPLLPGVAVAPGKTSIMTKSIERPGVSVPSPYAASIDAPQACLILRDEDLAGIVTREDLGCAVEDATNFWKLVGYLTRENILSAHGKLFREEDSPPFPRVAAGQGKTVA